VRNQKPKNEFNMMFCLVVITELNKKTLFDK
jgi:hypothetical protein